MRALIYTRVSRDESGEGRSNDRQFEASTKLCEAREWEIVGHEPDISISAWSGKERPAWKRVLQAIEDGMVDVVVAYHLDRMTRSMTDLEQLILLAEKRGVGIATVTGDIDLTTDTGRMVARILAAVARQEVERKAARMKLANAQRATEGRGKSHRMPFGYTRRPENPDKWVIVPEQAEAIREGAALVLAGESLAGVARKWTADGLGSGYRFKDGPETQSWSPHGVKTLLINPRYAGRRMYLGEFTAKGDWEAILDEETHLALVDLLTHPSRQQGSVAGRTPTTLLSGILKCSVCEGHLRATIKRGRPVYLDVHSYIDRELADDWARANLTALLEQEDVLERLAPSGDDGIDDARERAGEIRARLNRLAATFASGLIDEEQLAVGSAALRKDLEDQEARLLPASTKHVLAGITVGGDDVEAQFDALPLARQRALMDLALKLTLYPQRAQKWASPVERIDVAERLQTSAVA